MIHRKFIALIAATSIAVTGLTAAPAQAKDDTAKIIAGVAALALIGVAISKSNKSRRNRTTRSDYYNDGYRNDGYRDGNIYNDGGYRRDDDYYYDGRSHNRPLPHRVQRKVLPRSCKVQARTRNGRVPAYSGRCLNNSFRYANALPRQCSFRARTSRHGSRHTVYAKNCLAQHGYRPGNY